MTFLASILFAIICAVVAVKKAGFYAAWATFLNLVFAIYLSVHLVPVTSRLVPALQDYAFGPVLWTAGMAFLIFAILQILYSLLMAEFRVTLPKLFETLGALAIGALSGVVLWGFVCTLLWISPVAENDLLKDVFPPDEIRVMSDSSVGSTVRVINRLSMQSEREGEFEQVIARLKSLSTAGDVKKPPAQNSI